MAITYLKRGKSDAERDQDDSRTRATVEATLKDIETRGDAAVRELSQKFDNYARDSFRLSQEQIDALVAELSPRELEDIRFAQAQVAAQRTEDWDPALVGRGIAEQVVVPDDGQVPADLDPAVPARAVDRMGGVVGVGDDGRRRLRLPRAAPRPPLPRVDDR